jgi:Proteins of 100 residues with WXG.
VPPYQRYEQGSQHQASQRAQIAHDYIVTIQSRLREIPARLGASWQGQAATVFQQVLAEWDPQFSQVIASLQRISEALGQSDVTYVESQTTAHELTTQLMAQLSGGR